MKVYLLVSALFVFSGFAECYGQFYPVLKFEEVQGTKFWRITPDYPDPNPPPLRIFRNDSTILEYTILNGYQTNFRSGPAILDLIAKQVDEKNNNLNLAWLIHDINYEGYLENREEADDLLYAMLIEAHIPPINAAAVYWGVWTLGSGHYHNAPNNPHIRFRKLHSFNKSSLRSTLKSEYLNLGLQRRRLENTVVNNKDEVRNKIRELFSKDAEKIIQNMDADIVRRDR